MIGSYGRRQVLAGLGAALAESACLGQQTDEELTPEQFGAVGDGVANDTAALAALAAEVMRRGGGTVVLRRTTYIVGRQRAARKASDAHRAPDPIFAVSDLHRPLLIRGNGATLRCAPGLKYGSFDPSSGGKRSSQGSNYDGRTGATPYASMIAVERCEAAIEIIDLELDGNSPALVVGGSYGDVGIQLPATGIFLQDNRGDEILRRLRLHQHGLDGLMINGLTRPTPGTRRIVEDVRCERNGRQGCSIIGGRDWRFDRCTFVGSGRAGIASPPGAGVDIEAEGSKVNRDHAFVDCSFVDNYGCGLVADSGDSAGVALTRCRFVGTTSPSVWPNKPGMRFDDCRIVGTMVACFGDADLTKATKFTNCLFTDDPKLSPSGKVYRQERPNGSLADLATRPNVQFDHCRFLAVGGATLPWSTGAIYRNCIMRQTGQSPSYPRGTFVGRNAIVGPVDLNGSRISGTLTVNGVRRS